MTTETGSAPKSEGWSLDSLVLIFSIVIVAQLLTYVVPQGEFQRQPYPKNPSREMVVPGSYSPVPADEHVTLPPWQFLTAIPEGLAAAQEIVFLVFLVGGVIAILRATGAIDAALHTAVARLGRSPWILIAGCLILFAMGSWTIGMGEEYRQFGPGLEHEPKELPYCGMLRGIIPLASRLLVHAVYMPAKGGITALVLAAATGRFAPRGMAVIQPCDSLQPAVCPCPKPRLLDRQCDKVAALVRPTQCANDLRRLANILLVGAGTIH